MKKFIRNNLLVVLLFFVIASVLYSPALKSPFKTMDDQFSIVKNENIRDVSSLKKIFTESFFANNAYYRPFVYVSYMIEYKFFKLDYFYYNLTNILLHALISVVVFLIAKILLKSELASFFCGLIYLIHPIHWEAVCNISGRSILLSALGSLVSFLFFLKSIRTSKISWFFVFLSVFFFWIGLLSKESSVVLPAVITMYFILCMNKNEIKTKLFAAGIYWFQLIFYFAVRNILGIKKVFLYKSVSDFFLGFVTFLRGVISYFRLYFFPVDLHYDRSFKLFDSFYSVSFILTILFYLTVLFLIIKNFKRIDKLVIFLICWFFIDLMPVAQIFTAIGVQPGYISVAEHFLYVASVPAIFLIVMFFQMLYQSNIKMQLLKENTIKVLIAGFIIILSSYTVLLAASAVNERAMFERTLKYAPYNLRVLISLGLDYAQEGEFREAQEIFEQVLAVEPQNPRALIALGKSFCDQDQYVKCIDVYESIKHKDGFEDLLDENLKLSYNVLIDKYKLYIRNNPDDPIGYYSLGVIYSKTGKMDLAIDLYLRTLELESDHQNAMFNLATSYDFLGRVDLACKYYKMLLQITDDQNTKQNVLDRLAVIDNKQN